MSKVYRISSVYGTEYTNTMKEAERCKPGGEEPEFVNDVDAAGECNSLTRQLEEEEKMWWQARQLLERLFDMAPVKVANTDIGKRISKFLNDHPLPPADACNRDGQRSYGRG